MDATLIANQCVDSQKQDSWYSVKKMSFGERLIRQIKYCISIARFSVFVKCNSTGFFLSQRGSRQGDPLSPFI